MNNFQRLNLYPRKNQMIGFHLENNLNQIKKMSKNKSKIKTKNKFKILR